MPSYRRILYHIVFRTKYNRKAINQVYARELYAYMMGVMKNKDCFLYRINGIEDHIHILCELHPSISLADFIREIKVSSSIWMKQSGKFPRFVGWAIGYGAFTYAWRDKDMIVNYIRNQQKHHAKKTYEDELRKMLRHYGIDYDEKYFP